MRDFALEVYFSRWEFAVRHNLTASDSETLALADLLHLADDDDRRRWETLSLGYTDPCGSTWLRETISQQYDGLTERDILCTAGAQEGIFAAMNALLRADDHAVVVTPNYQSAETVPATLCPVTGVALDPAQGWTLDIDAVAAAMRPTTRLVSINFPNNPTGKILERDRFDALVDLCRARGVWLFSDEIYRAIDHDPQRTLPQAVDAYEHGISLNGLSKGYGLPGLRMAWLACRDSAVLQRIERVKHYLSICNAGPTEVLARIALKSSDDILTRNRRIATANLRRLSTFFAEFPDLFDAAVPDGGVVTYPRYLGAEGVDALAERLIEQTGLLILPASLYRSELTETPADRFRIGFGRADFPQALDVLRRHLHSAVAHADAARHD